MASAPRGQHELDFEAEEMAVLRAAGATSLDLVVEDSGNPEHLGGRLSELGGMPVVHLFCHGLHEWQDFSHRLHESGHQPYCLVWP